MNDAECAALRQLIRVGRFREHKALAHSLRALDASRRLACACRDREAAAEALTQMQDRARLEQIQRLQAGHWPVYLQRLIDRAQTLWRQEQQALVLDRERWQDSLREVRRAARAVAAAQERTKAYVEVLYAWQRTQDLHSEEDDAA